MKIGNFILAEDNGISNYMCICQLVDESYIKTVSCLPKYYTYFEQHIVSNYKQYTILDNKIHVNDFKKPIKLSDPDFINCLTKNKIREDCKAEFAAFLQNLVQQELKEVL